MANSRLLQAIINRFSKGGGDSTKLPGLSEVIPTPATKSVGETKTLRGPGPSQELFEKGELTPSRVLEDIPPGEPLIGSPRPQRPTTNVELSGRTKAMELKAEREAAGEFPDFEINELFNQSENLLPDELIGASQGELRKLGLAKRGTQEFRKKAGRAAEKARETSNPSSQPTRPSKGPSIEDLREEFTAPLDPNITARQENDKIFRMLDILRQREQRNLIRNKK